MKAKLFYATEEVMDKILECNAEREYSVYLHEQEEEQELCNTYYDGNIEEFSTEDF